MHPPPLSAVLSPPRGSVPLSDVPTLEWATHSVSLMRLTLATPSLHSALPRAPGWLLCVVLDSASISACSIRLPGPLVAQRTTNPRGRGAFPPWWALSTGGRPDLMVLTTVVPAPPQTPAEHRLSAGHSRPCPSPLAVLETGEGTWLQHTTVAAAALPLVSHSPPAWFQRCHIWTITGAALLNGGFLCAWYCMKGALSRFSLNFSCNVKQGFLLPLDRRVSWVSERDVTGPGSCSSEAETQPRVPRSPGTALEIPDFQHCPMGLPSLPKASHFPSSYISGMKRSRLVFWSRPEPTPSNRDASPWLPHTR